MLRWPGHIKAGTVSRDIVSGLDWFPTLLAAAGDTTVTERLLKGWAPKAGGPSFKNHLDGNNLLPYLEGKEPHSPRHEFFYFNDDGVLVSMRVDDWKFVFCEQRLPGGFQIWANPFTCLRIPKVFNRRMDPFERADIVSDQYYDWTAKNGFLTQLGGIKVAPFLQTFKAYPPSQRPASFTIDQMTEAIMKSFSGSTEQSH
jgi:arylsulfatase